MASRVLDERRLGAGRRGRGAVRRRARGPGGTGVSDRVPAAGCERQGQDGAQRRTETTRRLLDHGSSSTFSGSSGVLKKRRAGVVTRLCERGGRLAVETRFESLAGGPRRSQPGQRRQAVEDVGEARGGGVLAGEGRGGDRPGDADGGVVPGHRQLVVAVVEVGALVLDVHALADDAEAVGEAGRDPELAEVLAGEGEADPAAERGRAAADVHRHVEHLALDRPHELALGLPVLRVQAPQGPPGRVRVVVLDEGPGDSALRVLSLVVGLEEEAAGVLEDVRLDQDHAGQVGREELHRGAFQPRPSRSRRYAPDCTASHQRRFARYQRTVSRRPSSKACRGAQPSSRGSSRRRWRSAGRGRAGPRRRS